MPWAEVKVPDALQKQIFPFCEDVLARLRVGGCQDQGTFNFLELLQRLRPFFWRVCNPESNLKTPFFTCSFRLLVRYRNIFLIQESSNDSIFYLNLKPNYIFSNGLACAIKKRLQMPKHWFLGMHFKKLQLETPFHPLRLKSMG